MVASKSLQLTLAIIKPDVTRIPYAVSFIRNTILNNSFFVVRSRVMNMSRSDAEAFYAEHEGKFFYNRLVTFMSSGTSHIHILGRDDAIKQWRALMGPTKVFKTKFEAPETIRGQFGLTDTRNCTHGSDSNDTARREIEFFFPEFDFKKFGVLEETAFLNGDVTFDEDNFVHILKNDLNVNVEQ